jgi:hypothetical protein
MHVATNADAPWTDYDILRKELRPSDSFSPELPNWFASVADELHAGSKCIEFWLTGRFLGSLCVSTKYFEVGYIPRSESARSAMITA